MTRKIGKKEKFAIIICLYFFDMILESSCYANIRLVDAALSAVRIMILSVLLVMTLMQMPRFKQKTFFVICLFVLFSIGNMIMSGGGFRFLIVLLIVINSRKINIEYICKCAFWAMLLSSLLVIFSSLVGIIPDDINYRRVDESYTNILAGDYIRHSYGFMMSNVIPFIFSYLYFYRIVQKNIKFSIAEHLLFQVVNVYIFTLCGSRAVFVIVFMVCASLIWWRYRCKFIGNKMEILKLSTLLYPVLTIGSFALSFMYGRTSINAVNIFFNFRLSKTYRTIQFFGLHLIGNQSNVGTLESQNGVVVDSGYAMLFLQKGIIVGVIVIGIWTWITYYSAKNNDFYILIAAMALGILNVIDYHFTSFMNIPLYCIIAKGNKGKNAFVLKKNSNSRRL